jgi:hypothetical protein
LLYLRMNRFPRAFAKRVLAGHLPETAGEASSASRGRCKTDGVFSRMWEIRAAIIRSFHTESR